MVKRRYKQFCPVARTLDIVGERWTLLIVRDLLRGPRRYTDLRNGLPGMASNLLAHRLGEMEAAGLIRREHRADPEPRDVYVLTDRGMDLKPVLLALGRFGLSYLDLPTADEPLRPDQLPEGLATLILTEELPDRSLSIRFLLAEGDFTMQIAAAEVAGQRRPTADRISVDERAADDPSDVTVSGSMLGLLLVRRGDLTAAEAIDQGLLGIEGRRDSATIVRRLFGFDRTAARGGISPPAPRG